LILKNVALIVVGSICVLSLMRCTYADDEQHAIQGEWRVISQRWKAKDDPGVSFQGMRYAFAENSFAITSGKTTPAGLAGKPPMTGPYSIDDTQSPRHLTYTMQIGDSRREVQAIYRIEDKNLWICFGKANRPTSFNADDNSMRYVLERVVADEPQQ